MLPYPVEKIQNVLHQNTQNLLNASMLEKVCEGVLIKNFLLVKFQIISSNTATRYLRLCVCFQCCFYVTYMHESQILRANIIALCVIFLWNDNIYFATATMVILKRETRKHIKIVFFFMFKTLLTDNCTA